MTRRHITRDSIADWAYLAALLSPVAVLALAIPAALDFWSWAPSLIAVAATSVAAALTLHDESRWVRGAFWAAAPALVVASIGVAVEVSWMQTIGAVAGLMLLIGGGMTITLQTGNPRPRSVPVKANRAYLTESVRYSRSDR